VITHGRDLFQELTDANVKVSRRASLSRKSNPLPIPHPAIARLAATDRDPHLGAILPSQFNSEMFYTAGYDSPFRLIDRHNEVWVSIQDDEAGFRVTLESGDVLEGAIAPRPQPAAAEALAADARTGAYLFRCPDHPV